uniref:Venom protein family 1 protein 3 n=1 Tax=Pristhesancus plagipennis TaxID=1955184 RepID=A0A1Q1NPC3_PRIPG|nr:venom protein family 1 protein 3 [Pristhesancus plagipennis]
MAKLVFISFVLACFYFIGIYCDADLDTKGFFKIRKNAVFQYRLAKVEIEQIIFQKVHAAMRKATEYEQKTCVDDVKMKSLLESGRVLDKTVGKILPAIEEVTAALTKGDNSKLMEFNNKWDYEQFKKEAADEFQTKSKGLANAVQQKLDKCTN